MKITRRQLRKIIKETFESIDPDIFSKLTDIGNSEGGKDQVIALANSMGMNDILPDLRIWSLYDEMSGVELIGGYTYDELHRIYKDLEQYLEGSWWDKDDEGQMTFKKVKKADFYDTIIGGAATKLEEDELEELLGLAASALGLSSSRERALSESADMISKLLQMDPKQAVAIITSLGSGNNDLLYAYSDAVEREYNKAAKAYRADPEAADYWLQKRKDAFDVIDDL